MNQLAGDINKIERIRRQLYDMKAMLMTQKDKKKLIDQIGTIDTAFLAVEGKMIRLKVTGTGQDDVRYPAKLASRLYYLASAVAVSDFPPTDQDVEVYKLLHNRILNYTAELKQLIQGKFAAFMKVLSANNISPIIAN